MTKLRVADGVVVASEKVDRTFRFDDVRGLSSGLGCGREIVASKSCA